MSKKMSDLSMKITLFLVVLILAQLSFAQETQDSNSTTAVSNDSVMNENATDNQSFNEESAMLVVKDMGNNTLVIQSAESLDDECALQFECKEHEGQYWFNCYYDAKGDACRCYLGQKEQCNIERSSFAEKNDDANATNANDTNASEMTSASEITGNAVMPKPVFGNIFSSPMVRIGAIVLVIALIMAIFISRRETPSNNLKKAVNYHRLAEHYHEKGDEDKASHYYKIAEAYRKRNEELENVVE